MGVVKRAPVETADDRFWWEWQWGSHRYYGLDFESMRPLERLADKWFHACMRRLEARERNT